MQKYSRSLEWPLNPSKPIVTSPPGNDELWYPTWSKHVNFLAMFPYLSKVSSTASFLSPSSNVFWILLICTEIKWFHGRSGFTISFWAFICRGCSKIANVISENLSKGVQPFGISVPHWMKSCLGPHIKYIVTYSHKNKNLIIFKINLQFCVGPHS